MVRETASKTGRYWLDGAGSGGGARVGCGFADPVDAFGRMGPEGVSAVGSEGGGVAGCWGGL
jgi:hypothetical protein